VPDLRPDDPTPDPDAHAEPEAHVPLAHHLVSEVRKLLVPIITVIITALAAGGFAEWRAGAAKDEAVEESEIRAEERAKVAEEKAREIEALRTELRKLIIENASWDEVGDTLEVDEARILEAYTGTAMKRGGLTDVDLRNAVHDEVQQIQAQTALPPRPAPR
jgi:hypothetical protein